MCTGPRPFIPASGVAKLEFRYTVLGEKAMNVVYFQKGTQWNAGELDDLVTAAEALWTSELQSLQHPLVTLNELVATDIHEDDGAQVTEPVGAVGTAEITPLPNNVTIAVSFRTGFTGRSRRGRLYHIGLGEQYVLDNNVTAIIAAAILGAYGDMLTGIATTTSSDHVIVSYCGDGDWRTNALITPVTSYTMTDTTVDTQRKRLPA